MAVNAWAERQEEALSATAFTQEDYWNTFDQELFPKFNLSISQVANWHAIKYQRDVIPISGSIREE